MKEIGLGSSWVVLEEDVLSLEKGPGVVRDLYLVSLAENLGWLPEEADLRRRTGRRRFTLIRRFVSFNDFSKSLRIVPSDTGQGRCDKSEPPRPDLS